MKGFTSATSGRSRARRAVTIGALVGALLTPLISVVTASPAAAECRSIPSKADMNAARIVYDTGKRLGVNDKVMLAGFETGWVESHMNNLPCGDRDSLGVFQQRPSQGWGTRSQVMNVAYAATSFFTRAIRIDRAHPGWTAGQVSQAVQISAFPSRYDQAAPIALSLIATIRASTKPVDMERVSDFNGDGRSDVLGVDRDGKLRFYPHLTGNRLDKAVIIGQNWHTMQHVMAADWSGDGHSDVLGVNSAGLLMYYANNGNRLSPGVQIGHGWTGFKHVMAADWSGDGKTDVLGVGPDDNLYYYPHQGTGFGPRVKIGQGWGNFTVVMAADFSGDGKADVLGVTTDGKLWYYPHQGTGLAAGIEIGHGWQSFQHVMASDYNGDGIADLIGVDANGLLWLYPHTRGVSFGQRVQIGHGWLGFSHVM